MPNWLQRVTRRGDRKADERPPAFATRLPVDSPGAPGRDGAEALYAKWADRWQEF